VIGAVSPPSGVRFACPALAASTRTAPYGSAAVAMEVRQAWTIRSGAPGRRTSGSTKPALAGPDDSRRGTSAGGRTTPALLPLTTSDVGVGVTAAGFKTARVARVLVVGGAGCEPAAVPVARELVMFVVSGAAAVDVEADAPPSFPLLVL